MIIPNCAPAGNVCPGLAAQTIRRAIAPEICRKYSRCFGSTSRNISISLASLSLLHSAFRASRNLPGLYVICPMRTGQGTRLMWTLKMLKKISIRSTGPSKPDTTPAFQLPQSYRPPVTRAGTGLQRLFDAGRERMRIPTSVRSKTAVRGSTTTPIPLPDTRSEGEQTAEK